MTEIYPFMREYELASLLSFVSINLFQEQYMISYTKRDQYWLPLLKKELNKNKHTENNLLACSG